ncbi:unnamed protein product [Ilex paraguariensis]|uniref:Uncharacterized protein n=1 Tax=Ilex paraguariensis TaxID=185542 RepID=A0ABC8UB94_9AQUA
MDPKTVLLKIADLGLARAFTLPVKKYTHEVKCHANTVADMKLSLTMAKDSFVDLSLTTNVILTLLYGTELLRSFLGLPITLQEWTCAELVTKQAFFPRDSELQQLLKIFRLLGTLNEKVWPGVSKLMNWHEHPKWRPQPVSSAVPNLDEDGLDLLFVRFDWFYK